jgi:hypothetical protein
LALFAIIGIGSLIAANLFLRSQKDIDAETLCPVSGPVQALAILLDVTDPLAPRQQRLISGMLRQAIMGVPVGTRVTLGVVSANPEFRNRAPLHICKPLQGEDANAFYQNPKIIAERFQQGFLTPLDQALADLLSGEPADTSPIMESIQATVITAFQDLGASTPKRLIVVSDLLQHSDVFSFYRGQTWADFERSPDFVRLGHNLTGAEVLLHQLPRPQAAKRQGPEMVEFWARYFEAQGADRVRRDVAGDL